MRGGRAPSLPFALALALLLALGPRAATAVGLDSFVGPTDTVFSFSCDQSDGVDGFSVHAQSGIAYVADRFGKPASAMQFSMGSYLTTSEVPAGLPLGSADRTVSAWALCNPSSFYLQNIAASVLLEYGGTGSSLRNGLAVRPEGVNSGTALYLVGGIDIDPPGGSRSAVCDNMWHHTAIILSSGIASIAVDGIVTTSVAEALSTPASTINIAWSGHVGVGYGETYSGIIDDVRIYSRALSAAELVALSQPPLAALLSAYPNSAVSPSSPTASTTSYAFSCVAPAIGTGSVLAKSGADGSWAWTTGVIPFCSLCPAGSYVLNADCAPCSPGTYSLAGASSCKLCPAGTFGDHAGLTSALCSGPCASCTAGSTTYLHAPLSCSAGDARAVPTSLGLQIWPAANPSNAHGDDLLIAPLALCQQMASSATCAAAASVVGADGVTRYVVGMASAFNVEPAESLMCGEIPIGAAAACGSSCSVSPSPTPSSSPTQTPLPSASPLPSPSASPLPPFHLWVATGPSLIWDQVVGKGSIVYATTWTTWTGSPSNVQPYNYVYKSTDYGNTWSLVFTAPLAYCAVLQMAASNDGTKVIIGYACGPNPIFITTDSGSSWNQIASGAWPTVAMAADGSSAFYAANGGIYRTINNGATFNSISNLEPGSYMFVNQGGPARVLLQPHGNPCSVIHISTDGGASFSETSSASTNSACPFFAISSTGTTIYQAIGGTILKSTDTASTWSTVYTAAAGFAGISWCDCSADASTVACGAIDGTVVFSTNSGLSWNLRQAFVASGNSGAQLTVSSDGTRIYFAQGNLQSDGVPGHIFVSAQV